MRRLFDRVQQFLRPREGHEAVRLGHLAEAWLGDEAADTAIARMRQEALDRWLTARTTEQRELCWYEIHRIDAFVRQLHALMQDATLITHRQANRDKRKQAEALA